jgi:chemotaxis regulatin CheY-phosphate phosphatase CheZ
MAKNQLSKFSTEFLNKTIQVWQPFTRNPISLKDAREITENMTALFNFLITEEKKSNDKNINKNIS